MTATPKSVSVLGLGLMGSALVEALLAAGHRVTVWNRSPAKTAPLAEKGARPAATPAEAIAASDVAIVCVSTHTATRELLDGVPSTIGPKLLVQLSTMTADDSRDLAAWAHGRDLGYLDGSILGLPSTVIERQATVVFSGPQALFAANQDLFQAFGSALHLSPEIGASPAFDRVWYAYAYGMTMAFIQGAAMSEALGFSLETYCETVKVRTPVIAGQLMGLGERIAAREFATKNARIDVWADAFEDTLAICRREGVDERLPGAVMDILRRAGAAGHGGSDLAATVEVLKAAAAR